MKPFITLLRQFTIGCAIPYTDTEEEICKYELNEDFPTETAIEFGRLYLDNGEWKFEAIGIGHKNGLQGIVDKYRQ